MRHETATRITSMPTEAATVAKAMMAWREMPRGPLFTATIGATCRVALSIRVAHDLAFVTGCRGSSDKATILPSIWEGAMPVRFPEKGSYPIQLDPMAGSALTLTTGFIPPMMYLLMDT